MEDNLEKTINKTINADGGQTKVIELAGKPIQSGLKRQVNFGGNNGCQMGTGNQRCIIHNEADCRIARCVNNTSCTPCERSPTRREANYVGTMARTAHSRQIEHKRAILGRNQANALYKHQVTAHPKEPPEFETTITRGGFRWNLERQIFEALEIEHLRNNPHIEILNLRAEWGNRGLPCLTIQE